MFRLVLLDVVLVPLLKVLGQDDVPVLTHGLHAGLLANGVDVCAGNLVRSEIRENWLSLFQGFHKIKVDELY